MSLPRYFLNIEDRVPLQWLNVLERGAIVNGTQTVAEGGTLTVHAGHECAADDKFLFAPNRTSVVISPVYTVSSATSTELTIPLGGSFPDKSLIINLGQDTGGEKLADGNYSRPNWDAAVVPVYKDPAGDDVWASSRVDRVPGGEVGFWSAGGIVWAIARDGGGLPVRVYMDLGSTEATARDTSLPSVAVPGQIVVLDGGAGVADIIYIRAKFSDDTYDWLELSRAT